MAQNGFASWLKTLLCLTCFPAIFCLETSNSTFNVASRNYSIVHLRNSNQTNGDDLFQRSFCVVNFENKQYNLTNNVFKSLYNLNSQNLCRFSPEHNYDLNAYYLFHYSNSCSVQDQIENFFNFAASFKPSGILFSTPCDVNIKTKFNLSNNFVSKFNFLISVINEDKAANFVGNNQLKVVVAEQHMKFPTPLIGIFGIAILTVCIGSYWSGLVRFEIFQQCKHNNSGSKSVPIDDDNSTKEKSKIYREQAFTNISILTVVILVCCMVTALLLLYFFYKYLVYFILSLFLFTSMTSIYLCLASFVRTNLPRCIVNPAIKFNCTFYCIKPFSLLVIDIVLITVSIVVPIYWFVVRHTSSYAWVLQDTMGVFFCINMLRTLRLPSFKICVILELILFVYDIFFVFITPLFTSKGHSIMVEVATGGSGSSEYNYLVNRCEGKPVEALPMLFRVPRLVFGNDPYDLTAVCLPRMDSMLGFGDVMIPGLLIAYCAAFDRIRNIPHHLYFVISIISYGIGLIITFAALYLMRGAAQPALLYLVPCTLLPVFILSLSRHEFRSFWQGPEKDVSVGSMNNSENSNDLLNDDNLNQS